MITDTSVLAVKQMVDNFRGGGLKFPAELPFPIGVYNQYHRRKLVREKCGCDFKNKMQTIGNWIDRCFSKGEIINE